MSSRSMFRLLPAALALATMLVAAPAVAQTGCPCQLSDNGSGTVDLMPTCPTGYEGQLRIDNGLPAGDTIEIEAVLRDFAAQNEVPGGTLGGHVQTFNASLEMTMVGTGGLAGFNRFIVLPVTGEAHSAPRAFGDAVQDFDHDMIRLDGQLFGDPDFCSLEFRAGSFHGLPSPGHTTLTRLGPAGSPFQVDSFFDIAYEIEFQGCPGSVLDGMSGTSSDVDRFFICSAPVPVESTTWGLLKARH